MMALHTAGPLQIEFDAQGDGPLVVLIHSSASGHRQWRPLGDALKDRYRVIAPQLHGYGQTTPWPALAPQTLYAQAQLVLALCEHVDTPVHLVGHSFGGSVALKAAELLGPRAGRVVLFEPNPFHLLQQAGCVAAWCEIGALSDHVKCFGALGDWPRVAQRFADYWVGDGAWQAMPEARRAAFARSLPPNFHEWDAVMNERTPIEVWRDLPAQVLVLSDPATRAPIAQIVALLARACPHWRFCERAFGGHMAPLTHPERVNPVVQRFLDTGGV